jgi:leucyl aminopeptidase
MFDIATTFTDTPKGEPKSIHIVAADQVEAFIQGNGNEQDKALFSMMGNDVSSTQCMPFVGKDSSDTGYIVTAKPSTYESPYDYAHIPNVLPALEDTHFKLQEHSNVGNVDFVRLGWMIGQYQYSLDHNVIKQAKVLDATGANKLNNLHSEAAAIQMVRNLINTPPNIMGPSMLSNTCSTWAKNMKVNRRETYVSSHTVHDVTESSHPLIHAVGRAATEKPTLFDATFTHANANTTKATLLIVGKGVTYDSGGLAIKDHSSMATMHKDMGGAAHALGLACMILDHNLPVNVRVVIPIVENATDKESFKNGDVIQSLSGEYVSIRNTDAEGRLVLADAFTHALRNGLYKPDMIIDMATLTGAGRTASYKHHPSVFTTSYETGQSIYVSGRDNGDPVDTKEVIPEYLPSVRENGYLLNSLGSDHPGHVAATSFLHEFVKSASNQNGEPSEWVHVDTAGWQYDAEAGRPTEGSDRGMRAVAHSVIQRFG